MTGLGDNPFRPRTPTVDNPEFLRAVIGAIMIQQNLTEIRLPQEMFDRVVGYGLLQEGTENELTLRLEALL